MHIDGYINTGYFGTQNKYDTRILYHRVLIQKNLICDILVIEI
jgi:hypothetical protein